MQILRIGGIAALGKLNRPLWPFLVLLLSPIVTAPITAVIIFSLPDCGADEPWWELPHMQRAFLPALVDLLPFLWLASPASSVKWAATIAGLIGAVRFAFPQMAIAMYAAASGGQIDDPSCSVSSFLLAVLAPSMLALWLITSVIGAFVLRYITRNSDRSAKGRTAVR